MYICIMFLNIYFVHVLYVVFFFLMIRRPPRSTRLTHSFPTRRSSDLLDWMLGRLSSAHVRITFVRVELRMEDAANRHAAERIAEELDDRSEEHTSELQSLMRNSYAVFCLKKKTNKRQNPTCMNEM